MNKKILSIYLSIVCYITSYAQVIYTKQDSVNNNFYSICEEINTSNLLITNVNSTVKQNLDFSFKTQLLKISNTGLLLDSIQVETSFYTYGPILVSSNFYYVYGVSYIGSNLNSVTAMPTIIKYDTNLNVVARTYLNVFNANVASVVQSMAVKNNRIYIGFTCLYNSTNVNLFYKLDDQLNKLDSAVLNGTVLLSMINYGDNIMVSGDGFDNASSLGRMQAAELDTSFNRISYFNMDSLTYITAGATGQTGSGCSSQIGIFPNRGRLHEISNNKYFVSGYFNVEYNASCQSDDQNIISVIKNNSLVIKTNILGKQNGIHEASNYFANTAKKYNYLYTVSKSNAVLNNPFVPQNIQTEIMVSKVDTNGNVIWNNYYNTPGYFYDPYGIDGTKDSGVVVCGVRYNILNHAIAGVCEGFVMKIDKNGNQVFVNVYENNKTYTEFLLYPNPTANETYISINCESAETATILITDMLGNMVQKDNKALVVGSNSMTINTSQLSNGIYNLTVSSKNGRATKKLLVTR